MTDWTFINRRLHSFLGIFPVGLFILVHYRLMSYSIQGPEVFDQKLLEWRASPYFFAFETIFIYIPILYHAFLGMYMSYKSSYSYAHSPYFTNLRYILQRLSGIGLFFFVFAHFYKTRGMTLFFGHEVNYASEALGITNPLSMAVYLLGLLGTAYHFANGIYTFCMTWGITAGEKSKRFMSAVSMVLFVILLYTGVRAVRGFDPAKVPGHQIPATILLK